MSFDITRHKLPDEAFWQSSQRGGDALAREPVGDFHGLLMDAPCRVLLAERETLPFAVYHHAPIRQMAFVDFTRLGLVLAIDPGRNRLHLAPGARLVTDDDPAEPEPPETDRLPDGDMSTTHSGELRRLLGLPWAPATLLLSAQLRSSVSNRVRVELIGADEPAVSSAEPTPTGPRPIPATVEVGDSPADAVAGPGLWVEVPRVVNPREERYWPLSIHFAMGAGSLSASIHVVVLGADDGCVEHLLIEPQGPVEREGLVRGACVIDLARHLVSRRAQTYFVMALSGELMSEPVMSALLPTAA